MPNDKRIVTINKFISPGLDEVADTLHKISNNYSEIYNRSIPSDKILKISQEKNDFIMLTACLGCIPAGFKIGFAYEKDVFYSWVGGVDPNCRRFGVGSALMEEQHRIVKGLKFSSIVTKCRPQWSAMMQLNFKHGFEVEKEYIGKRCRRRKFLLRKHLHI